jgi:hypothetical protein
MEKIFLSLEVAKLLNLEIISHFNLNAMYFVHCHKYQIDSISVEIYIASELSEIFELSNCNSDISCKYLCLTYKNNYVSTITTYC